MPRKRSNPISDDEIVSAYERLRPSGKTAEYLGLGVTTVSRVLKRRGVNLIGLSEYRASAYLKEGKAFAGKYQGSTEEILAWYQQGLSIKKIARLIGRSTNVVALRVRKAGLSRPWRARGPQHSMWCGGRIGDGQGYMKVWVPDDDLLAVMRDRVGYVKEHRLVMARHLGRPLKPSETVHHINGDKADNRLENLQLRQGKHGKGAVMCCLDCGSANIGHRRID